MARSDIGPRLRRLIDVGANGAVQPNLSLLDQHHDSRGGELLGDGSHPEDAAGLDRSIGLEVGGPVSLLQNDLAIFDYRDSDARDAAGLHLAGDVSVYLVGLRKLNSAPVIRLAETSAYFGQWFPDEPGHQRHYGDAYPLFPAQVVFLHISDLVITRIFA